MKGMMRFEKKWKHSLCYVDPYQILRHFGKVAYKLDLPSNLASMHPVFYVSLLKKCICDTIRLCHWRVLVLIKESIFFEEVPVEFLDRQVCELRNKEVSSAKVLWRNQLVEGATWIVKSVS
ncbi:hypothetical protein MTR67_035213 [Solanum verrucosum]|uniref:Tf2-1-like SH3-like domain-containing protein n=1 Tax=Solanum verrucosum TaxID=315347 RepID=A0AAF0U956_SOLVR|nr:hypothetical protein MTR67_035213 [Solanum verrucosum]